MIACSVQRRFESFFISLEIFSFSHYSFYQVYVVERMSAEGKFFHRSCFRCDYCNILLRWIPGILPYLFILNCRLGSYVYHREGRFAGKFFCIPHSTETALEKYKYKKKIDEIQAKCKKNKLRKIGSCFCQRGLRK